VNNSGASYVFSGSSKLSGTASLTKSGSSSLTLAETGGDDFTGGIVVNGGTVILDNTNSTIAGGLNNNGTVFVRIGNVPAGDIVNNGALWFQRTGPVNVGTGISGSGILFVDGATALTLTGANSYTGSTIVYGA